MSARAYRRTQSVKLARTIADPSQLRASLVDFSRLMRYGVSAKQPYRYLSWPKKPIRSGIRRSAPMTLSGALSDREFVTGSTHLRTVALAQKQQKGLSESSLLLLLPIGLPFGACIR
jgi:hypothetical protein